jgi:hypothetical protein
MLHTIWAGSVVSSYRQGTIHELFFKDGATEAQWFLAILTLLLAVVTFLLVTDSWRKGKEQRERWDRDERQRDKDRAEERERWSRDDRFRRLLWLETRFNSPGMITARKYAASEMLEFKLSRLLGKPTSPVRPVIAFLTQIAAFCKEGLLDIGEVDLAYRDHVMVVWNAYGSFLEESFQNERYSALRWLTDELSRAKASSSAAIEDTLTASISFIEQEFLEREANL